MQINKLNIKEPYTYEEIIKKYESDQYDPEHLLQHALLLLKTIKENICCK